QPNAGGGAAGAVCLVAGALRGAVGDGPGGGRGRAGPGSAVVRGLPADPALPTAGVPGPGDGFVRGVGSGALGRGEPRADRRRGAAQPDQPARREGEDVEVQEETSRASAGATLDENICRVSCYALLSGIAPKAVGVWLWGRLPIRPIDWLAG